MKHAVKQNMVKKMTSAVVVSQKTLNKPIDPAQELLKEMKKDMGKVALFVSAMAVVLMVLFYFTLKYNLMKTQAKVDTMYKQMSVIDKKVAELEKLPQKTRNIIYYNILEEMSDKANFLSDKLNGERKQKLLEAQRLIKEAQKGLDK